MWKHSIRTTMILSAILTALVSLAEEKDLRAVFLDDFSEEISAWTLSGDAADVTMKWDSVEGSPQPGSLSLSINKKLSDVDAFLALGPCMDASPGELWRIDTMVKQMGIGDCIGFITQYRNSDCTGTRTSVGNIPFIEPGIWHLRPVYMAAFSTTHSARAALLQYVSPNSEKMSCHFDSVVVSTDRAPVATDVPALSPTSLLILTTVLAVAAFALLRRRSTASSRVGDPVPGPTST